MPDQAEAQKLIIKILKDLLEGQQKQLDDFNRMNQYIMQGLTEEQKIKVLQIIEETRVKTIEHKERYESILKTAIENQSKFYDNELN